MVNSLKAIYNQLVCILFHLNSFPAYVCVRVCVYLLIAIKHVCFLNSNQIVGRCKQKKRNGICHSWLISAWCMLLLHSYQPYKYNRPKIQFQSSFFYDSLYITRKQQRNNASVQFFYSWLWKFNWKINWIGGFVLAT